ncbi:hypothetical protein PLESTF_000267500 [Pleodorina starrii]|nr:hypothetical protein PLESTF_000267500 [Pleodorina starrii]
MLLNSRICTFDLYSFAAAFSIFPSTSNSPDVLYFSHKHCDSRTRQARAPMFLRCLWLKYNTSGELEVEGKMLKAAAKEYKSKVHMRLFNSIAEKVENQIRLPQFSRLRSV